MSPEMTQSDSVLTPASDIYSFAMVLYELVTRKLPWQLDPYRSEQIQSVVGEGKRPTIPNADQCSAVEGCPAGYLNLMQRCWLQKPAARPSTSEVVLILKEMVKKSGQMEIPKAIKPFSALIVEEKSENKKKIVIVK